MMVIAHQGFILSGYTTFIEKKILHKPVSRRQKISLHTFVKVVCDEPEVEEKIKKGIEEEKQSLKGWGNNFEGWSEISYIVPDEYENAGDKYELSIKYVKDMDMQDIIKRLTGEEFRRFLEIG